MGITCQAGKVFIMEGKEIHCFQHCNKTKNILCFTVPPLCPLCGADTTQTEMRIPPYLIESPFTNGSYTQCAILVKPTIGHFLHSFDNSSDLHIGVTDSRGYIYEYDERGVTVGRDGWSCCLSIELSDIDMKSWDTKLSRIWTGSNWTTDMYNEVTHNCYDYVLEFLRTIGLQCVYQCLRNRVEFCQELIVPRTSKAGKYISLYRDISKDGFVVQNA